MQHEAVTKCVVGCGLQQRELELEAGRRRRVHPERALGQVCQT